MVKVITLREKRYYYVTPEDYEKAEKNGIDRANVNTRVRSYGWDVDTAITRPLKKNKYEPWERWKEKAVVKRQVFWYRLEKCKGWTEEEAAMTPVLKAWERNRNVLRLTEEQMKIAESNGLTRKTVRYRVRTMKWSLEKAISTPKMSKTEAGKQRYRKKVNNDR